MTDAKMLELLSARTIQAAGVAASRSRAGTLTKDELVTCLVLLHQAQQDLGAVRQRIVQELVDRGTPITELSPDRARRLREECRRLPTTDPSARSM